MENRHRERSEAIQVTLDTDGLLRRCAPRNDTLALTRRLEVA
jgi:hypothetical protein